jgi:xanthine/CO dehydrogenase XdhC/CoxF family maturation factor
MKTDLDEDVLRQALEWQKQDQGVALATVVRTWGSAPRRPGSHMAINRAGEFVGSVSGGCVEGAVITEASAIIETGGSKLLEYGVTNDQAWEVGLACGGTVVVLVERID